MAQGELSGGNGARCEQKVVNPRQSVTERGYREAEWEQLNMNREQNKVDEWKQGLHRE